MPGPTAAAGGSPKCSTALARIPPANPRQPQWTIATRSPSDEGDRQAIGDEHEQREVVTGGDVRVHLVEHLRSAAHPTL